MLRSAAKAVCGGMTSLHTRKARSKEDHEREREANRQMLQPKILQYGDLETLSSLHP